MSPDDPREPDGPSVPDEPTSESPTSDSRAETVEDVAAQPGGPAAEGPGTTIGPYTLIRLVGEGGFGSVFLAEQARPVRRQVALKILKLGMDTRQVVARFEQERQALAILDHPHIAKVFDAGATATGRPFFVMEWCDGEPIDAYCDRNRLSVDDRLRVFDQVCSAVQHAHARGLIHRDIKPSNVLVSSREGEPHARVIDFGIAKATAARLTEATLLTEHRTMIGTPEYMSPEQAEGSEDIDIRTDVYALGVMLYELLTGSRPFTATELRRAAYAEVQRIIREVDPPRPSSRLSRNTDTLESVAAQRRTDPRRLGTLLRGELDWIVMKCLEKDRARRYDTASGLATDIRRYLSGEPVQAAPPSTSYRLKKFVRRNRVAVGAAGLVVAALVLGLAGTSVGLLRSMRSEEKARMEATTAEQVTRFLIDLFKVADPGEARGSTITARELLEQGAEKVRSDLVEQPVTQARLMGAMSEVFSNLGLLESARGLAESSLEIRLRVLGEAHPDVAQSRDAYAWSLLKVGDIDAARAQFEELLSTQERLDGDEDDTLVGTLTSLATIELAAGDYEKVSRYLDRAESILEHEPEPDPELQIDLLKTRVGLHLVLNEVEQAKQLTGRILQIAERHWGADDLRLVENLTNQASALTWTGPAAAPAARALQQRALEIQTRQLGPDHPDLAPTMYELGALTMTAGDREGGWKLIQDAIALQEKTLGKDHPEVARTYNTLGQEFFMVPGTYDRALGFFERALSIQEKALGPDHPAAAQTHVLIAEASRRVGDYRRGIRELGRAVEIWEKRLGTDHPDLAQYLTNLANLHAIAADHARARELLERVLVIDREAFPSGHVRIARDLDALAMVHAVDGELSEASRLLEEAIDGLDDVPQNALAFYDLRLRLANVLAASGEPERAESMYALLDAGEDLPNAAPWDRSYFEACRAASRGDSEVAIRSLREAVDAGYRQYWLRHEPVLRPLHGEPEFEAMVGVVSARNGLDVDSAKSHSELGRIWYEKRRYLEAAPLFDEAARIDPANSWYPFMAAKCYRLARRYDEARPRIERALEMDSGKGYYHWERGRLEYDLKNFEEAMPHYRRAVELDPEDGFSWINLGSCLRWLERWDEARDHYRKANDLDLENPGPWWSFAVIDLYIDDLNAFRRTIDDGMNASPSFARRTSTARLLHHAGDSARAATVLEQVLDDNPDDVYARVLLSQVYAALGRTERSREVVRPVLETDTTATTRAVARLLLGDRAGSLDGLEQALADEEGTYGIAAGFALLGEADRALELLRRALEKREIERAWVRHDPDFASLRDDPRFLALVR